MPDPRAPAALPIPAFALILALGACASPGRSSSAPAEMLPTPYTAAELQTGNPPGTTRVYLISAAGQEPELQTGRFLPDEAGRARFASETVDLSGAPVAGSGQEGRATWEELLQHALFPAAEAARKRTSCTVAAGVFPGWLYERTEPVPDDAGAPLVHRFWFADGRPGPPVLYELTRAGELLYRMELVRFAGPAEAGSGDPSR
jgi:hypothetical protein